MSLRPAVFGGAVRRASQTEPDVAPRPHLKLVETSNAARLERLSPRMRMALLLASGLVVLFAVVAFHVVLSQGQFKLARVQQKADTAQTQYERLRLQVAQLESPSRITSEAQDRLNMVHPGRVTPVSPQPGDMPQGPSRSASGTTSQTAPPTTGDVGRWDQIKPYLSSSAFSSSEK